MQSTLKIAVGAAMLMLTSTASSGCSYNKFAAQDETIRSRWAEVENLLQRRNDLIPNLVNTVKGYATHEQEVFQAVAASRERLAGATSQGGGGERTPDQQEAVISAANAQSAALGRLLAVVENYPQLRANEQFNRLMDELSGTENRIAVARKRYNDAVQEYNTARRQFPANLTARVFGFKEHPYFQVPPEAQRVPTVDFSRRPS
jgi:LemA protein